MNIKTKNILFFSTAIIIFLLSNVSLLFCILSITLKNYYMILAITLYIFNIIFIIAYLLFTKTNKEFKHKISVFYWVISLSVIIVSACMILIPFAKSFKQKEIYTIIYEFEGFDGSVIYNQEEVNKKQFEYVKNNIDEFPGFTYEYCYCSYASKKSEKSYLKLCYSRNSYNLSVSINDSNIGNVSGDISGSYLYEYEVTKNCFGRMGMGK